MNTPKLPSQPGCERVEECIEICTGRTICVNEGGVQAWFRNPNREEVRKIEYDGCFDKSEGTYKADYIIGLKDVCDIVVELKGSHTNLGHALEQVIETIEVWRSSRYRYPRIAALIVYGTIWSRDALPRRRPKAISAIQSVQGDFRDHFKGKIRLLVHESGEQQFTFGDFLRKNDAV